LVRHSDGSEEKIVLGFGVLPEDIIYKETAKSYGMARGYSVYTRHKD